jgi:propanol-preferring alcohol dehydrogenase
MRAWVLGEQAAIEERPLVLVDVTPPHAAEGEVRLRVLACGVCRTDIHIAEGDLPLHKSSVILGHQIVGRVDEIGQSVGNFRLGDIAGAYWLHSTCGRCKFCLSDRENYCPQIRCTGWDVDGGFAEYVTVPAAYALPLTDVPIEPVQIAPLMCPGIAGYAALQLTGTQAGDTLGLYGFGPTAYYVLKVARTMGIEVYVSTRSKQNIDSAAREGARWAANAAQEAMPCQLDAAILFPPAGSLVEPILSQLQRGGILVMVPVSASPIRIEQYSDNLWGRDIGTLYHLKRSDAEGFFAIVSQLDLGIGTRVFPFEELQDALILARHGTLGEPTAVIEISKD